ncbi:MAG: cyclase family protein [Planctomycetota bacterium]|jgi:arylformamidase
MIYDITVAMESDVPVWPGSERMGLISISNLDEGDQFGVSKLTCDVHTGTHVDAPSHVLKFGSNVEELSLDTMLGTCFVAHLPELIHISTSELVNLEMPSDTIRLLFHTDNSRLWSLGETEFNKNYCALTEDAARWIVDHGIRLVGIDYLSVQPYSGNDLVHQILLEAGVVVLEGLNLTGISSGNYELICLPIKLRGAEGAPARVVLRDIIPVDQ